MVFVIKLMGDFRKGKGLYPVLESGPEFRLKFLGQDHIAEGKIQVIHIVEGMALGNGVGPDRSARHARHPQGCS